MIHQNHLCSFLWAIWSEFAAEVESCDGETKVSGLLPDFV